MFQIQTFCAWVAFFYIVMDHFLVYYFYDIFMVFDKLSKNYSSIAKEFFITLPFMISWLAKIYDQTLPENSDQRLSEDHFLLKLQYIYIPVYWNLSFIREELQEIMETFLAKNQQRTGTNTKSLMLMIEISISILELCFLINHFERIGKYPNDFSILNSLWYIIVTLSTIGYGDVSPTTFVTKIIVVIRSLAFYKYLLARWSLYSKIRNYWHITGGSFNFDPYSNNFSDEFVIFSTTDFNEEVLADFIKEFFSVEENRHFKILVVTHEDYSDEIKEILDTLKVENSVSANQIQYYRGSLIMEEDLHRLCARYAQACFIITARGTANPIQEDLRTIMRSMHFRAYAPDVSLYIHILKIQSKSRIGFAETVMCDEEMSHAMFALNSRIPGISTAVVCMCHTINHNDDHHDDDDAVLDEWEEHIKRSVELEIYDVEVLDSKIFENFIAYLSFLYRFLRFSIGQLPG